MPVNPKTSHSSKVRDLTKQQFRDACARHGFKPVGFMGYYDVGNGTLVSVYNAGQNRRAQLAYLIQQAERVRKEHCGQCGAYLKMPKRDPEGKLTLVDRECPKHGRNTNSSPCGEITFD